MKAAGELARYIGFGKKHPPMQLTFACPCGCGHRFVVLSNKNHLVASEVQR